MVNETAASTAVDETVTISDAMASANGAAAAQGVVSLFGASQAVLLPRLDRKSAPRLAPAIVGTADCTPVTNGMSTCTFTLYGDDTPMAGYQLDGTIVKNMDTYTFDLTYDVTTAMSTFHWTMTGAITTNATGLDGALALVGDGTTDIGDVDWEISVDYRDVQFGAGHCIAGGSLFAISSYSSAGNSLYDIDGELVFALTCAS